MVDEIKITNNLLHQIDGKSERTFAFPCGQTKVNDTLFYPYVKNNFVRARGVKRAMKYVEEVELENINAYGMKGHTGVEMIELVKQAMSKNKLLVFLFHGVGGGSSLNVEMAEHDKLVDFLAINKNKIWVAPMVEVAKFVKTNNQSINETY